MIKIKGRKTPKTMTKMEEANCEVISPTRDCCQLGSHTSKWERKAVITHVPVKLKINIYHTSLIRRCGYYFFHFRFSAATIRGWLLFKGGIYFIREPARSSELPIVWLLFKGSI